MKYTTAMIWCSWFLNIKIYGGVRKMLKREASKLLESPSVRTKNKVRLLEVMLKINMYRFYIPKAIRNGIEQIADE